VAATGGPSDIKVEKVAKATGADARTVEEIWTQREKLKGKPVAVRGQVVKFTPVMGKNFLHLRDGSGTADKKTNDLTITTADNVAVGDVVTAKGVIVVDKDFGSGYAYPVMIDDAKVSK
jgi:aspartyl/asparaginyl-tRNA synthetase